MYTFSYACMRSCTTWFCLIMEWRKMISNQRQKVFLNVLRSWRDSQDSRPLHNLPFIIPCTSFFQNFVPAMDALPISGLAVQLLWIFFYLHKKHQLNPSINECPSIAGEQSCVPMGIVTGTVIFTFFLFIVSYQWTVGVDVALTTPTYLTEFHKSEKKQKYQAFTLIFQ